MTYKFIISTFTLLLSVSLNASVWNSTSRWNNEWEKKYRKWVKNDLTPEIFTEGKYKGISTDCADAVYTLRAIFSYENKLPFHFRNPNKYGERFTEKMHQFNRYTKSNDLRFKKFINWMHRLISTHSVPYDTYSPDLNRKTVNSGTLFLLFNSHVFTIKELEPYGLPILYSSTVPRIIRSLEVDVQLLAPDEDEFRYGLSGFRNWRWPNHLFYSKARLKNANLESNKQYEVFKEIDQNGDDFEEIISGILAEGDAEESVEDKIDRYLNEFLKSLEERVQVVQTGYSYYLSVGRSLTTGEHYTHSTPSRDERLYKSILKIEELNKELIKSKGLNIVKEKLSSIQITIKEGTSLSAFKIYENLFHNSYDFSSDPEDSIEERWGIHNNQVN